MDAWDCRLCGKPLTTNARVTVLYGPPGCMLERLPKRYHTACLRSAELDAATPAGIANAYNCREEEGK